MQNRIASSQIKVGKAVVHLTEIQAVVKCLLYLFPRHRIQFFTVVLRKNIAVLTPLITFVCDMPLKRKYCLIIPLLFLIPLYLDRFLPEPCFYTPAYSTAGASLINNMIFSHHCCNMCYLSAAPQAVPHAAAVPSSIFLLQLKRLKSAILLFLLLFHKTISCLQDQCTLFPPDKKVRTILLLSYLFITHGFHWYVPL